MTHDGASRDAVDEVVSAWARERPDLELSPVALVGRIGRLALLLAAAQQAVFDAHGLRQGEFDVLASLRRAGEPHQLTPSRLAEQLLLSRAGMTARLDRLEEAGLVERNLDPRNRSSFLVGLTARGRALVDRAMTDHAANLARLVSGLSATEQAGLDRLLARLLGHLEGA